MMYNSVSKSGMFSPRFLIAVTLCSVGTLLALLSFAAAPSVPNALSQTAAAVITPPQGAPALSYHSPSPVASGPVQLRPSASIADLQSLISHNPAPQTGAGISDSWQLAPRTEPIRRDSPHVAYDSAHAVVVLFGGIICQGSCFPVNDTWIFDGSSWKRQQPAASPPARYYASIAYDEARQVVVLFGGITCGDLACTAVNDTWTWDGTTWTEQHPALAPPPRYGHAMAYDAKHQQVVLFSGCLESCPAMLSDTWTWDGSNWTLQPTLNAPPERAGASMSFDPMRGVTVLFSGGTPASTTITREGISDYNDTWTWDGSNWTQLSPATSPSGRQGAGMVFDIARGLTVLFGGYDDSEARLVNAFRQDTWLWDGTSWTQQQTATMPERMQNPGLAYDAALQKIVMIGGFIFHIPSAFQDIGAGFLLYEKDTWTLDAGGWTHLQSTWPVERQAAAMAYDANTQTVVLSGGFSLDSPIGILLNDTWTWDGTRWTEQHPVTPAPFSDGAPTAYHASSGKAVMLSYGYDNVKNAFFSVTWTWDGANWAKEAPLDSPPVLVQGNMVPDITGNLILFGGFDANNSNDYPQDTWRWDGANWSKLPTAIGPPGRQLAEMAYDADTKEVVLFGGFACGSGFFSCTNFADTWTWDGSNWTQRQPATSPRTISFASAAYDPTGHRVLMFGGVTTDQQNIFSTVVNDTWAWDGSNWSQLQPTNAPGNVLESSMVTFSPGGTVLLFGGQQDNPGRGVSDTWTFSPASPPPTPTPTPSPSPSPTPTPTPTPTATPTPSPASTPTVSVAVSPTQIKQGDSATFTVSASKAVSQSTTVHYSMSGSASLGTDYTLSGSPGQVTIPAGQSSGSVTLSASSTNAKKKKTATMNLQSGAGYKLGKPKNATVTIVP